MSSRGIIYYATGKKYVDEAIRSAYSVKKHNDISITVFTDKAGLKSDCFDRIEEIEPLAYPFYDRINYFKRTPYDRTLHLDTDTIIDGNIQPIFDMIGRFDIVAAINETRDTASEHHKFETVDINAPDSFPEYQCGVIGFNNTEQVMSVFDDWQSRYFSYRKKNILDQPFFREALFKSDVNIGTLPSEYNALLYLGGYFEQKVRIVHLGGTKPEEFSIPFVNYKSISESINELNRPAPNNTVPTNRIIFYDWLNRLRVREVTSSRLLIPRILQSIQQNGVHGTISIGLNKTIKQIDSIIRE